MTFQRHRRVRSNTLAAIVAAASVGLSGCEPESSAPPAAPEPAQAPLAEAAPTATQANPLRDALFGAVHVHTSYSFDAFTNGTVTTPSDAYDWAKGRPINGNRHGLKIQIDVPLDFYAVADHAEMMGVFNKMTDPQNPLSKHPLAAQVTSEDQNVAMQAFAGVLRDFSAGKFDPAFTDSGNQPQRLVRNRGNG